MRSIAFQTLAVTLGCLAIGSTLSSNTYGAVSRQTVADRLDQYEGAVRSRLKTRLEKAGVAWPPRKMVLIGLKQEKQLEVWVSNDSNTFSHLATYPILAASGVSGPKLAEGDRQVPEGLYKIESLNPNSAYHLALRINYPNDFDRKNGQLDGRKRLGSDIMIHGNAVSIGCLAMGDSAAEDLFVLAAKTGLQNISVILSPVDFRLRDASPLPPKSPPWTKELYTTIKTALKKFPRPMEQNP